MTKALLLMCFFLMISCTEEDVKQSDNTNGIVQFVETALSPEDVNRLRTICTALSNKEDQLSVLISSPYTFTYSYKGCSDSSLGKAQDVAVTIERPYGQYVFMRADGDNFAFPDVETATVGALAKVCGNQGQLVSPIKLSETGAMWFTSQSNVKRCSPDGNHYCVHIQKGSLVSGDSYQIHTNEWIKFKLNNPRRGFFVERTIVSGAACSKGQTMERKVVLK